MINLRRLPLFLGSGLLLLSCTRAASAHESPIQQRDDDTSALWTWISFQGCSSDLQKATKAAHEDAVPMAEHVKNIDFGNDLGALDYLGPSALNKDWQGNIQSVFDHIATFRLSDVWPGSKMNARCGSANDVNYQNRCRKPGVLAYQWNTKTDATDPNTAPSYDKADAVSNMHFCD